MRSSGSVTVQLMLQSKTVSGASFMILVYFQSAVHASLEFSSVKNHFKCTLISNVSHNNNNASQDSRTALQRIPPMGWLAIIFTVHEGGLLTKVSKNDKKERI